MKKFICLFFTLLALTSCASTNMEAKKQMDIAVATQRLGEGYYNDGKYTAALKNLLEAQKTMPDDPYLYNSLGLVYMAKNRHDLAEKQFKSALKFKTDYIDARNNLGAAYLKQKKWNLAIQCFEQVSQNLLYATPEMPLSNLGWAYFHQGMYKKAKIYFMQSLELRPDFLNSIHGLASTYIKTGHTFQAINYLRHELKKNPRAAILHSDLAEIYESLNDFKKAIAAWNNVLKLVPETSPLAREAQKRLFNLN